MNIEQAIVRDTSLHVTSDRRPSQPTTNWIKIETKALSRKCPQKCPCQCHVPLERTTPKWLQGLIGVAFVRFVGTPLLNHRSCDFRNCGSHASKMGSIRYSYRFPTWLLQTGIDFTASWCCLSGVGGNWSLRIPQTITRLNVANKMVQAMKYSSVIEVRRIMQSYGVRAFDIFHSGYGHSVFHVCLVSLLQVTKADKFRSLSCAIVKIFVVACLKREPMSTGVILHLSKTCHI